MIHIFLFIIESLLVGTIILLLFRLRFILGKAPIYISLGVFKYLHFFLNKSIQPEYYHGLHISIGSSVLMMAVLFAILLVYIIENALEARKIVLALITANIVFYIIQFSLEFLLRTNILVSTHQLPISFFHINPRMLLIGLTLLLLDGVIIIYFYELLHSLKRFLLLRISATMAIVISIHIMIYSLVIGGFSAHFSTIIISGFTSKFIPFVVYSLLFWFYMAFFEKSAIHFENRRPFKDVFFFLTLNPKYTALFDEKKMVLKAKEESEYKFKTAFKTIQDSININRLSDGLYIEINSGFTKITGYTEEDVKGKTSKEIDIWANYSDRAKLVNALRTKGSITNMESQFRTKDGRIITGLMSANIINIEGEPHILSVTRDISERKAAVEKVKDVSLKLAEAAQLSKMGYWELDIVKNNLIWSDEVYRIFGLKPQEFKATYESFLSYVHPEDRDAVNKAYSDSLKNKLPYDIQHRVLLKSGEIKYVREKCQTEYNDDGEAIRSIGAVLDITEQILAEQKIAQSQAYFQSIYNATSDAIFIHDGESGQIVDVNNRMVEMYGYSSKEEVLSLSFDEIGINKSPYSEKEAIALLQKCKLEGPQTAEWLVKHKDGSFFWTEVSARYAQIGNESRYIVSARNINERKLAEKALRESNEFSQALLSTSPDVIYIYDIINKKNIYTNQKINQILGYSIDEIKNIGDKLLPELMHPDDFEVYTQNIYPRYWTLKNNEQVYNEYRMRNKNGEWCWLNSREIIFNRQEDGSPRQILGISSDITEKKKVEDALALSETRYRYFVEQTGEGFYRNDSEEPIDIRLPVNEQIQLMYQHMYLAECNDVFAQLYGWQSAGDMQGMKFVDMHGGTDKQENINAISAFIQAGYRVLDAETKEVDKDGNIRYFLNNAVGIIENEKLISFWGTQRDITDKKRDEQKIQQINSRLEILHELDQAILESISVDRIAESSLKWLFKISSAQRISIALFDEDLNEAIVYSKGLLDGEYGNSKIMEILKVFPEIPEMRKGEIVRIPNINHAKNLTPIMLKFKKEGIISFINFPIIAYGKLLGSLNFGFDKAEAYQEEDLVLGKEVADSLAIATEQTRLNEEIKKHTEELEKNIRDLTFINDLSNNLNKSLSLEELAKEVIEKLSTAVKSDVTLFYVLQENVLQLIDYKDRSLRFELKGERQHSVGECLCGLAASTKKAVFSEDIKNDIKCTLSNCKNIGIQSFAGIPLIAEDKVIGIIGFGYFKSTNFSNRSLIETLCNETSAHLQSILLLESLKKHELELEQKVAERTEQLEFSNKELRDFAQVVSHDLKAPLRAISQLSYWISQDYADKIDQEGQEQLKLLIGRVQRLDNLIEGILQYSRAGKLPEKEKQLDLQLLVEDVIRLLSVPSHINIMIENKLPTYIGDSTRLGQLFQNLIDNAIKYMDKDQGEIKIGYQEKEGYYEFYVSDNGPGIEEKFYDRIFQIFQRLIARDEQEGTGVGLSLVKRIVQIYGGDIWLESDLGKGSTFYFTLPIISKES
jgi:PAS domain S-box-containing protein